MATKTIGQHVTGNNNYGPTSSQVDVGNPAPVSGILSAISYSIYAADGANTPIFYILRINGVNYEKVYEVGVTGNPGVGAHTFTLPTPYKIIKGDLLGWYNGGAGTAADLSVLTGTGNYTRTIVGSLGASTAIASFTLTAVTMDLYGTIVYSVGGFSGFSGFSPWVF